MAHPRTLHPLPRILLASLLATLLASAVYQLPFGGAINIGDAWDEWFLGPGGVYPPEQGGGIDFRWTSADARIRLPGLRGQGEIALSVWAAGRPGATAQELRVTANSHRLDPASLGATPQRIEWTIPAGWLAEDGGLELTLATATAAPPGDTRELGLLLDRVTVRSSSPARVWPDPGGLLPVALLAGLAALVGGRLGLACGVIALLAASGAIVLARPWYALHGPSIALLCISLGGGITLYRRNPAAFRAERSALDAMGTVESAAPAPEGGPVGPPTAGSTSTPQTGDRATRRTVADLESAGQVSPSPGRGEGRGEGLRRSLYRGLGGLSWRPRARRPSPPSGRGAGQVDGGSAARWLSVALFALYLLLLPGHFYVIDDDEKYRVTEALVTRGDLRMDPPIDGRVYSKYGLGHSIASAPLLLLGLSVERLAGQDSLGELRKLSVLLLNPLCTAITAGLLFTLAARLWRSPRRALLISATYGLATLAFPHALFAFSEPLIGMLLLGSFYCLFQGAGGREQGAGTGDGVHHGDMMRLRRTTAHENAPRPIYRVGTEARRDQGGRRRGAAGSADPQPTTENRQPSIANREATTRDSTLGSDPPSPAYRLPPTAYRLPPAAYLASAGALFGFLVLTKAEFVLVGLLLAGYYLYKSRAATWADRIRGGILFLAPACGFLVAWAAYNFLRYGGLASTGYEAEPFSTPLWTGLYGLLLSSGKSLFLYSPPLLLSLLAWPRFWRAHRAEAVFVAVLSAGLLLFYARWWQWSGDWTWGPRFTLPLLPLLVLAWGGLDFEKPATRITAAILLAAGAGVQMAGILAEWRLNFLRFGTPEEIAARMAALWFDPLQSPILLNARRLAAGPEMSAVLRLPDYGLPPWTGFWIPHLLAALLIVSGALVLRSMHGESGRP